MKKSLLRLARAGATLALGAVLWGSGATLAQAPIAKLVVRDLLTGGIERIPLQSFTLPNGNVRWSSGDMASPQGQILAWRMGQRVAEEGSLWKVPLQPDSSGEARIESRRGRVGGTIRWKAVPAADGELALEADVTLDSVGGRFMPGSLPVVPGRRATKAWSPCRWRRARSSAALRKAARAATGRSRSSSGLRSRLSAVRTSRPGASSP